MKKNIARDNFKAHSKKDYHLLCDEFVKNIVTFGHRPECTIFKLREIVQTSQQLAIKNSGSKK